VTNFKNIRTGVIGLGVMGRNHARVLSNISNLIAVCDIDSKTCEELSKKYSVQSFNDYNDFVGKVDAVSVCVPTIMHEEVCEAMFQKGIHVIVEKPLSFDIESSKRILESSNKNNIILAVGHIERHNPAVAYAKKCIENSEWGDIITLSSRRVSSYPSRISDVGVILDLAVHDLDVLSYLANSQIRQIFGFGGSIIDKNREDFASLLYEFKNGIKGYTEVNWLTPMKVRQVSIVCTDKYIELDYSKQTVRKFNSSSVINDKNNLFKAKPKVFEELFESPNLEPLKIELLDFLSSIENSHLPLVTGEDGLHAVRAAVLASKSISTNEVFNIQ